MFAQVASLRRHPFNEGRGWAPVLSWQATGRVFGRRVYRWVDGIRFEARPGMHGITPSIPTGLAEYHHMAFTLHFLRRGDLLIDVGANVGGYTLLAAAAGAEAIAVEPSQEALPGLRRNLALNGLSFEVHDCALGTKPGSGHLTEGRGAMNRLSDAGQEVRIGTLDEVAAGRTPALVKIDVEGTEAEVIAGDAQALANCPAVIAEVWSDPENEAHKALVGMSFRAASYDPKQRALEALDGPDAVNQNTLYIRDLDAARARVKTAPTFDVMARRI